MANTAVDRPIVIHRTRPHRSPNDPLADTGLDRKTRQDRFTESGPVGVEHRPGLGNPLVRSRFPMRKGERGGSCSTPEATTRVKARNRRIRGLQISIPEAHLKLWQEWGRSVGLPVHWPLWPAPLPPLVGGLGLANAGPAVVRMPAVTSAIAAERNRRFLIEKSPPPNPPEFSV